MKKNNKADSAVEVVLCKVGEQNNNNEIFTEEFLSDAIELDEDLVFDKETGELKLVMADDED